MVLWVLLIPAILYYLVYRPLRDSLQGRQALNWPSVQGSILDGHAVGRRQPRSNITWWYASLSFYFPAEGAYYGNRFEIQCGSEEAAEQIVRDNKGKSVTVRYKPGDPDTARAYPDTLAASTARRSSDSLQP